MSLVDNRFLCLSGGSAITRHFAQLDSVLMSYHVYANELVFSIGDTLEFEFLAPNGVLVAREYLCDATSSRAFITLEDTGLYNINGLSTVMVDGVTVSAASSYPTDGKLHKLIMTFTSSGRVSVLGTRGTLVSFYSGIMANPVATIGGQTTTNTLGLATGNSETSEEVNNTITYVNIPDGNREKYTLTNSLLWTNISPLPQELPATIEVVQ